MDIQVVLTENDPKLGKRGQVIKVSSGYAQNYLFPHKKAQPATPAALKQYEAEKTKQLKGEAERLSQARAAAERLKAAPLRLELAAGEGEKLFGAVTAQHILDTLQAQGIRLDRKSIHLEEPIKKLGIHEVACRLHPEVSVTLRLEVVKK